jgi:hypothetical protein
MDSTARLELLPKTETLDTRFQHGVAKPSVLSYYMGRKLRHSVEKLANISKN